jgi:cytochrome c553
MHNQDSQKRGLLPYPLNERPFRIMLRRRFALLAATAAVTCVAGFSLFHHRNALTSPKPTYDPPASLVRKDFPAWPYPRGVPDPRKDDGTRFHLPGSNQSFTLTEISGRRATIDWFPDRHPVPPPPVIDGRAGAYNACGQCHLIDGSGKPDTSDLRGLSVDYIVQQITDMQNDRRHASIPHAPLAEMVAVSKGMTLAEARQAAEYFNSIKPVKRLRIIETDTVPVTRPGPHAVQLVDPSGATEPIGSRIIEIPENVERTELRDPSSGFIAYVPRGSIKRGEELAKKTGGNGKPLPCGACHGDGLKGRGEAMKTTTDPLPVLAGHSPTAIARQLYDFKSGTRDGKNAYFMKPVVRDLTDDDIVDLAAYVASLQP